MEALPHPDKVKIYLDLALESLKAKDTKKYEEYSAEAYKMIKMAFTKPHK